MASPESRAIPSQVVAPGGGFLADVIAIASGSGHKLALKRDGTVWAWGSDYAGQLGDGTVGSASFGTSDCCRPTPQPVPGLQGVVAIDAGIWHSLAIVPAPATPPGLPPAGVGGAVSDARWPVPLLALGAAMLLCLFGLARLARRAVRERR